MKLSKKERDKVICENMDLVHKVMKDTFYFVRRKSLDYEDCFQVGCMALIKAVDKFDETKGIKLSTYACKAINSDIRRYLNGNRKIHIPEYKIRERIKNGEEVEQNDFFSIDAYQNSDSSREFSYDEDFSAAEVNCIISDLANGNSDIEMNIRLKMENLSDSEIAKIMGETNNFTVRMRRKYAVEKAIVKWGGSYL